MTSSGQPLGVLVAGGGVAAIETVLALGDLAGDRVRVTLLAPGPDFVSRPAAVGEPFADGHAAHYPLAGLAERCGARLVADRFEWVDPDGRVVHTKENGALSYDVLVLALGAAPHASYPHAVTVDDHNLEERAHGLIQDVEMGYVKRVAFVAPARMGWPLPIYELALMTRQRSVDMYGRAEITLVIPEAEPLEIFGAEASRAVRSLIEARGIRLITAPHVSVPDADHVLLPPPDGLLEVDRVIALPELFGPHVRGIRAGDHGFIPVGDQGRVAGFQDVYAAGDMTDYPVKHGGISAQQADAVATDIAARAGAAVSSVPFRPLIRGMLLTGEHSLYLQARLTGGRPFDSQHGEEPLWSPPTKIASGRLAAFLDPQKSTVVS